MGALLSKNEFPVNGRISVLITGGSKGLGLHAARQLAEKGANVIIVARDIKYLRYGVAYISNGALNPDSQRFYHISADVTTASECARVVAEATAWNNGAPPDIVWCCSGSAHPTLFVDTPVPQFQAMMDSNYFSCVYMAHAILNVWLGPPSPASDNTTTTTDKTSNSGSSSSNDGSRGGSGDGGGGSSSAAPPARHIIFTGSFVSFYSFAGFTPYAPSKAAVRSLSDSLSQELNLYAAARPDLPVVRVHTVFPATMPTQSLADENAVKTDLTKSLEEGDQVLPPEECARRAIAALESGEELVPTSTIIRLVMASVMGGSVRGGFWRGLVNTVLGWITMVVMVFIRWEMDTKVRKWGKRHGASGMLKKES
ncbi:NAD(P)-binding protein [Nemania sp. FL0031]|nr:NAD(P)-binding protein [Nemania sp. FL0031]